MPNVIPQGQKGTIWFGGNPDESHLCLRVCGDALDPNAVSRALGCEPSRSRRKGEPVLSPTGQARRIARTGSWLLDYPVGADNTISDAIKALLGNLPTDESVWASLASQFAVDLICDVTVRCVNRGFELAPEVSGMMALRGITLGFDIFCEIDPREAEALQERLGPPDSKATADRPTIDSCHASEPCPREPVGEIDVRGRRQRNGGRY